MLNFTKEDFDIWYMGKRNKKINYLFNTFKKIITENCWEYFGFYKKEPINANFDDTAYEIAWEILNTLLWYGRVYNKKEAK